MFHYNATRYSRVILFLLIVVFVCSEIANAQIAPTNSATVTGSLSDKSGKPVAGAQVSLRGPKQVTTTTDTNGAFVFVGVPFGQYQLSAASDLGTVTRLVAVRGDTNVAIQYLPLNANGLKVIANVATSANANFNVTPASITQVNPIAEAFDGQTSWRTILEQIPGIAQAGLGAGSTAVAALPDGPMMPVQISINGALPYETATLLDDMPLIGSSYSAGAAGGGTDLGLYPLNGFGSADVIRGPGAAAPSIVDSIGGSFVLHAPGAVNENHYVFSVSDDPYGGIITNALAAVRWRKLSVVVTYGVNDSPGPISNGTVPSSTVFSPLTVNGATFSAYSPPCSLPSCEYGYLVDPNYATFAYYGKNSGFLVCCSNVSTAWSQHSGSIALNYEFSPAITAEIFYTGQVSQQSVPYQNFTADFLPPTRYSGGLPAGLQVLPSVGTYLAPTPMQNIASLLEEKITAQIGNGLLQVAALQNRVFTKESVNTPSTFTQQLFGGGTLGGVQTVFDGGTYSVTYPTIAYDVIQNSDNRDLLLGYTVPLGENLRAGASYVQSYYDIPFAFACSYGAPYSYSVQGSTPSAVSQTTDEMRVFIGDTPSAKTSIDLAAYFANADYHVQNPNDSTGNTYVDERYGYAAPRLGFVWRPTTTIAVRAAAGGGFAEAPLNDLVGATCCSPYTGNGFPSLGSGYYSVILKNVNLQPEKSFGFDLGTDIQLRRNLTLSFDLYHTNLYGQIYQSTSLMGTHLGLPLYATQYGNLGESRYAGVLLDLRHEVSHGIYWSFSGGLTRGYVVNVPAGFYNTAGAVCNRSTDTNCTNVTVVPGINFNEQFTAVSVPYSQGLGTIGYRWNNEKYVDVVGTYYGNNNTYFRPAFVELDGSVGYPLSKNVSLLVTFKNITGIYDGSVQLFSAGSLIGVPTIAGLPYPEYGEEYGPRTVLLTTIIKP